MTREQQLTTELQEAERVARERAERAIKAERKLAQETMRAEEAEHAAHGLQSRFDDLEGERDELLRQLDERSTTISNLQVEAAELRVKATDAETGVELLRAEVTKRDERITVLRQMVALQTSSLARLGMASIEAA